MRDPVEEALPIAPPTEEEILLVRRLDHIVAIVDACTHPYTSDQSEWCNLCGAYRLNGRWFLPHHRDLLLNALRGLP
jgi:hypothetical protein